MSERIKPKAPEQPTARRKRRTANLLRAKMIEAAASEFKTLGFAGATTAAIARKADVTEAQLFRYFRSKAQLFQEAVFDPIDTHLVNFVEGEVRGWEARSARAYVTELQTFIGDNRGSLLSVLSAYRADKSSSIADAPTQALQSYFDHGAARLAEQSGRPPEDYELIVRVAFGAVLGPVLFKDWLFANGKFESEAIANAIGDFIISGVDAHDSQGVDADVKSDHRETALRKKDRGQPDNWRNRHKMDRNK